MHIQKPLSPAYYTVNSLNMLQGWTLKAQLGDTGWFNFSMMRSGGTNVDFASNPEELICYISITINPEAMVFGTATFQNFTFKTYLSFLVDARRSEIGNDLCIR